MEKLPRCFMSVLFLVTALSSVLAEDKFFGDGGVLYLRPPFSGDITSISWKHKNNLVAEWIKDVVDLEYYDVFKGRTTLDITTAALNITPTRAGDSGEYTVEINNRVQPVRYNVKVLMEVPQPSLEFKPLSCAATSTECILHCLVGELTEEKYGPVTYSWKMGDKEWMDGEKSKIITNDKETRSIKTFYCRMKNPVSEKVSDIKNIFYDPNAATEDQHGGGGSVGLGIGIFIVVLLLIAVIVFVVLWKLGKLGGIINRIPCLQSCNGGSQGSEDPENPQNRENEHVPLTQGENNDAQSANGPNAAVPNGGTATSKEPDGGDEGAVAAEPNGETTTAKAEGDGEQAAASKEDDGGAATATHKAEGDGEQDAASKGGDGGAATASTGDADGGTGLDSKPADDGHNVDSSDS